MTSATSARTRPRLLPLGLALALALVFLAMPLYTVSLPATVRIPAPHPHPGGFPAAEALFSHDQHASFSCYACHPSIFPQARKGFTHADMNAGRYCGHCHDGRAATAVARYRCESCHVPYATAPEK